LHIERALYSRVIGNEVVTVNAEHMEMVYSFGSVYGKGKRNLCGAVSTELTGAHVINSSQWN
jgi:hypothetical protein